MDATIPVLHNPRGKPVTTTFASLYEERWSRGAHVCVGLDPDLAQLPEGVHGADDAERVYNFMCAIVSATHHVAAAFKPQSAYYEALGEQGHRVLRMLINHIRQVAPEVPVILDYKRGDIGRSNQPYVDLAFDLYGADAVTISPYLGMEAMQPFLVHEDKLIIVLCRTSNDGAGEFQDVPCIPVVHQPSGRLFSTWQEAKREGFKVENQANSDEPKQSLDNTPPMPLYEFVARRVAQSWNSRGNCAVVVGATYPAELGSVREILGDKMFVLIPGLGTQGADLEDSMYNGIGDNGAPIIPNNSSAISFAYAKLVNGKGQKKYGPELYHLAAREAAETMNDAIAAILAA